MARSPIVLLVAGLVAILAGLMGLAAIGYWYAADMGWTGSGSTIVVSRLPILTSAIVAGAAVFIGLLVLLLRNHVAVTSPAGLVLVMGTLLFTAAVWVAVDSYPQVVGATLIAHGDERWRTQLPITEVFGVLAEDGNTITITGRAARRACESQMRSVTLDLSTGRVLAVETLPTFYLDESEVPPLPTPVDFQRFEVQQGSAPFICRN